MLDGKQRGWKVLSSDRRSLMGVKLGAAVRDYPVGVEVRPAEGCGPLAVFSTAERAKDFIIFVSEPPSSLIVACDYVEDVWAIGLRCYVKRLKDGSVYPTVFRRGGLPEGTVLARSVTCLE